MQKLVSDQDGFHKDTKLDKEADVRIIAALKDRIQYCSKASAGGRSLGERIQRPVERYI
jgi:hypothetical protein